MILYYECVSTCKRIKHKTALTNQFHIAVQKVDMIYQTGIAYAFNGYIVHKLSECLFWLFVRIS
ncbi:hypothetical protein DD584_32975, partial [Klebsiella pneumoniae]